MRDTGSGIAESELPRVFERFHRVKNTRARTHEGTGIGLALVQELARLHGGSVAVASREGQGSTFTVSIRTGTSHLPPERIAAARQLASTGIGASPYVEEALRWLPGAGESTAPDERLVRNSRRGCRRIVSDTRSSARRGRQRRHARLRRPAAGVAVSRRGRRRRTSRPRAHRGRSSRPGVERRHDAVGSTASACSPRFAAKTKREDCQSSCCRRERARKHASKASGPAPTSTW